jgi:hypothetical protein
MRKLVYLGLAVAMAAGLSLGAAKGQKTFTGEIGDSMCGPKHMMEGGAKECTQKCVDGGSKYVLVDAAHNTVYELSDQTKPKEFAGQKVKVTGTLKGKTIQVESVEAEQ